MATTRSSPRRRHLAVVLLGVVGVLLASAMVWNASTAAFTATTSNGLNTFSAGTVSLTDSDANTSMFTVPPYLAPGDTGEGCVRVTYTGSLAADVELYTSSLSDAAGLGGQITIVIEEGTKTPAPTPGSVDCTGFVASTTIATGTLATLGTTTTFANGFGTWAATTNQTKDYKFSYTFASGAGNSYQNTSASITFVWEARNS